jgi:hypothetical protein
MRRWIGDGCHRRCTSREAPWWSGRTGEPPNSACTFDASTSVGRAKRRLNINGRSPISKGEGVVEPRRLGEHPVEACLHGFHLPERVVPLDDIHNALL